MIKKSALTIAGSDSSGGAGIQSDLKTMQGCGVFGMSAITVITAQNTTGVRSIMKVTPALLQDQIDMVFEDIYPDAVKIGMTFDAELIEVIEDRLKFHGARNIVLDPVMVATSGAKLLEDEAKEALCERLIPLASVITPNIPEAEALLGNKNISGRQGMEEAAKAISQKYNCAVLVKGGHMEKDNLSADVLCTRDGSISWYQAERIDNPNTHGTGCTLSSAIASNLALGFSLEKSISNAKDYLEKSIKMGLDLGRGRGPLWHYK